MTDIEVVDAQVHAWEAASARYPYDPTARARGHDETPVPAAEVVRAMAAAGVHAAVIVASSVYGSDSSYALDAAKRWPGTFRVVARVDHLAPDLEHELRLLRADPAFLGIRVSITRAPHRLAWERGEFAPLLRAAEHQDVALSLLPPRILDLLPAVAERHPGLRLTIDHLGLGSPPTVPTGPDPFEHLPEVLALARYRNVTLKLSSAPSFSLMAYPFRDIWPHVHRVIDAFGPDRVMWGSDFTRVRSLHSYREALGYVHELGLSDADKELILGATLRRVLRWPR